MLEAGVCLRATARWSGSQIEVDSDIQYNTRGVLFCFGLQQAGSIGNQVVENGGQAGTKLGIENLQILVNLIHGCPVRPGWVDQGRSRV